MFRPRVIPVLLLKNKGLVKTKKFKKPNYIGDPINAVKIFNDLKADELILVDIDATKNSHSIPLEVVREVGEEAFMPFAVGGGIKTLAYASECIGCGAEKIILNTHAIANNSLITQCANKFGSQSVVVAIDVKKDIFGRQFVYHTNGTKNSRMDPVSWAVDVERLGAGEILINDVNNDGLMQGYDVKLITSISEAVNIPVLACGGAGGLHDLRSVIDAGAHGSAAGSLFVYQGSRKAVLINYPTNETLIGLFR